MKSRSLILFLSLAIILAEATAAFAGEKALNGGDACENRIQTIRDDIASWIRSGGSNGLKFQPGYTLDKYNNAMLLMISKAIPSCTQDRIKIGGSEKSCENFIDRHGVPRIVCNDSRFMGTAESDQYVLVHHEYAGLAGFEANQEERSRYLLSNQITEYLADEVVKRLVVKPDEETVLYSQRLSEVTDYFLAQANSSGTPIARALETIRQDDGRHLSGEYVLPEKLTRKNIIVVQTDYEESGDQVESRGYSIFVKYHYDYSDINSDHGQDMAQIFGTAVHEFTCMMGTRQTGAKAEFYCEDQH